MSIQQIGISSYQNALNQFQHSQKNYTSLESLISNTAQPQVSSFAETLSSSLAEVNNLQAEKSSAVTSFASGETQNVHELMITLQKAGVAINMTTAVRNKAMEAYQQLSTLQF